MGKTLPPFNQFIDAECRRWAPFKRALPKEDQAIFDRLFDCAKHHIQAGVVVSRPWPFETIVLAILLEQQKLLEHASARLEALEQRKHGQDVLYLFGELSRLANRLPALLKTTAKRD
jgi:hypothetical protein